MLQGDLWHNQPPSPLTKVVSGRPSLLGFILFMDYFVKRPIFEKSLMFQTMSRARSEILLFVRSAKGTGILPGTQSRNFSLVSTF